MLEALLVYTLLRKEIQIGEKKNRKTQFKLKPSLWWQAENTTMLIFNFLCGMTCFIVAQVRNVWSTIVWITAPGTERSKIGMMEMQILTHTYEYIYPTKPGIYTCQTKYLVP